MIVTALLEAGRDPSFVNGGVIGGLGVSSAPGSEELFVVEADESDGSFLLYDTSVALITNVDADHLDHYGSHEAFDDAFVRFASAASELVVISSDDPGARRVTARIEGRVVTFGEDPAADIRITDIVTDGPVAFTLTHDGVSRAPRSASRAATTRSTRRAPTPCSWASAWIPTTRSRDWPASRAQAAASSCTRRSAA
ncbi:UDP-N-acetylmuramate--L-alanine ligase [Clavibacter michiganensis subsp. michiganensis]|uniref:UDP-N-acetylmuramate--L-alanine ligase n=1 Tax=Clavibacter michiganensis subsp. michiganensis TaxID=33013 RepID=A0A251XI96_CLAMM|nr:UDP-N-acetylmuramate--L-alanine ligase [Clavibacter michiganensis subsp. michiganensis]OUE02613.1 UDP-N-acetylmuramate--L-alanine ligase [Clavibacter michiganensis subsp. michiganensis]